jgi:hypothetical protein
MFLSFNNYKHGEMKNSYKVLVGKPQGRRPRGRPMSRWEDNIKLGFQEIGRECG